MSKISCDLIVVAFSKPGPTPNVVDILHEEFALHKARFCLNSSTSLLGCHSGSPTLVRSRSSGWILRANGAPRDENRLKAYSPEDAAHTTADVGSR